MPNKPKPKSLAGNLSATELARRHSDQPLQQLHHRAPTRWRPRRLKSHRRHRRSNRNSPRPRLIRDYRVAAKKLALSNHPDSIICIGCVLRGETSHYEHVSNEVARGIQLAQMDTGVPIAFCVLTCDTLEQAIDRAGLKSGNKGFEAGLAAVEMGNLSRQLRPATPAAPPTSKSKRPRKRH